MRAMVSAARARSVRSPAATSAVKSSRKPPIPDRLLSARLAELDHVAVRIADPELRAAEVEVADAARVEQALHLRDALHLEREVRAARVDVDRHRLALDQVELRAAEVVPRARHAEIRPRCGRQPEEPLVERARAREVADAHGCMVEATDAQVAHVASTPSTRKVASGPCPSHEPIHAIQYLPARSPRIRASSTGSVTALARPRRRTSPASSATSGVFRRLRTQSRLAFSVAR